MQICCRFHCFCSPCVHSCQHCVAWILSCLLCLVWGLQCLVISLFGFASFWCVLSGKQRVWWPQFAFQRGCCCIWWPGSCPLGLVWCGDYGFCPFKKSEQNLVLSIFLCFYRKFPKSLAFVYWTIDAFWDTKLAEGGPWLHMCQQWLVEMVLVRFPLGSLDSIWNPLFSKQKPVRPQSKSGTSCEQTSVNKQWQCAIEWGGVQSKLEFPDLGNQQENAAFDY